MNNYDLLIIGAGTAGMACALTAAQRGLHVGVLEKSDRIGGALHWSGGHMSAGGTQRQQRLGIEDSPDRHFADIQRITEGTGHTELIRLAVDEAPKTIDWLEELGFEFAAECPRVIYGHVPYDTARTHYGVEKALSIYKVLRPLWDEQVAAGRIDCRLKTAMTGLRRENGRYTTVEAGTQVFRGRHIVLATGGYGSNPDYFAAKHPNDHLLSSAYPTATGDGHQIAEALGGDFAYADCHLPSLGGVTLAPGRADFNQAWAMVLTSIYRQPREIYLNARGERFMAEDEKNADTRERIVMRQPQQAFWLIFDEKALLERTADGLENPVMIGWDTARIKAEAKHGRFLWTADDLPTLCAKAGLPAKAAQAAIERFNQQVDEGKDEDFDRAYLQHKVSAAPYYALKVHASVLVTFGGMKVNAQLQLLDRQGQVMPGLYGAGELLGLGATSGKAFCSGMAITPALAFGRLLGKKLN